jgi:hypothetical protein
MAQNAMELGAFEKCAHLVVGVEQLNRELLNRERLRRDGLGQCGELLENELQNNLRELLGGHTRHLESPVREEFHIDLLEIGGIAPLSSTQLSDDEGALIKEGLHTHSALGKHITCRVSNDLCLMFHLQNTLRGIANRNKKGRNLFKEFCEIDCGTEVARCYQS